MKKKTSTIFTLALAAMLGMGVAEANAQRVVYKGTATINQKDGTSQNSTYRVCVSYSTQRTMRV